MPAMKHASPMATDIQTGRYYIPVKFKLDFCCLPPIQQSLPNPNVHQIRF